MFLGIEDDVMRMLGFSPEELDLIVQACALIEIDDCTPPYLQDFIVLRLADEDATLAHKVRRLTADEMDELCEHIKQHPAKVQ
jgi:hypothetical protein